jgi:hypothetical protein
LNCGFSGGGWIYFGFSIVSLPRVELEDPAFRLWTHVEAAKTGESHAFPIFKAFIERFDNAVYPGCCCCLVGIHPCSQQANEILFLETISHHFSPYKPAAVSSSFKVESRLCRLRNPTI